MPIDPGAAAGAVAEKGRVIWWLISSPLMWALWIFGLFHAYRYSRIMARKDLEEWRSVNKYSD